MKSVISNEIKANSTKPMTSTNKTKKKSQNEQNFKSNSKLICLKLWALPKNYDNIIKFIRWLYVTLGVENERLMMVCVSWRFMNMKNIERNGRRRTKKGKIEQRKRQRERERERKVEEGENDREKMTSGLHCELFISFTFEHVFKRIFIKHIASIARKI